MLIPADWCCGATQNVPWHCRLQTVGHLSLVQEWFHAECVGSTAASLDALSYWRCPTCMRKPATARQNTWMGTASPAALPPAAAAADGAGTAGDFLAAGTAAVRPPALALPAAAAPTMAAVGPAAQPLAPDPLLEVLQSHLAGYQQQQQQQALGGWAPATSSNGSGSGIFGL